MMLAVMVAGWTFRVELSFTKAGPLLTWAIFKDDGPFKGGALYLKRPRF